MLVLGALPPILTSTTNQKKILIDLGGFELISQEPQQIGGFAEIWADKICLGLCQGPFHYA